MKLSRSYGTNICLGISYDSARKKAGTYNYGIVCSRDPLTAGQRFQFEIDYQASERDGEGFEGSVQFGVTAMSPDVVKGHPYASEHLKGWSFILADLNSQHTCLFIGGKRVLELPEVDMRSLSSAAVSCHTNGSLHFFLNHCKPGQGSPVCISIKLPSSHAHLPPMYGVVDLYGRCSRVKLVSKGFGEASSPRKYNVNEEDLQHILQESAQREAMESLSEQPSLTSDGYFSQVAPSSQPSYTPSREQQLSVSSSKSSYYQQNPPPPPDNFSQVPPLPPDDFSQAPPLPPDDFSQAPPHLTTGIPQTSAPKTCVCGYMDICWRFLREVANLESDYFDSRFHKCYCESCHTQRKEPSLRKCGDMRYAVPPEGWAKFGKKLNNEVKVIKKDLFRKGFKAYHGTQVSKLKSILEESGQLLPPGVPLSDTQRVEIPDGHYTESWKPGHHDPYQIFLTPSLVYATHGEVYAKTQSYTDPNTQKTYQGKVCLKVLVEPDAYKVSNQTLNTDGKQIDPLFDNTELEWSVKACTKVHIYGLLVKLVQE